MIGAGAGGHAVSAQLVKSGKFNLADITMYDPHEDHVYQPAFTMVGGGVLGNEYFFSRILFFIDRKRRVKREHM